MNNPRSTDKYRPDVDGLRAIAILAVLLFHAFPSIFPGGFIGVDIFFVISGFLISSIIVSDLNADTFSFSGFYKRRIRRIFPALITVMLSTAIFGYFSLLPDELQRLGKHIMGGGTFSSNLVLLFESGYFNPASIRKPLLHLWSLGIEEQFYIFFPLILYLCFSRKFRLPCVISILAVISFLCNLHIFKSDKILDFYLPFSRVWELLAGAALSTGFCAGKIESKGHIPGLLLSVSGFALLILGFTSITPQDGYPGYKAVLPVLGTILLITAGQYSPLNKWLLANRYIVFIGLISYPLYLWHWPLLSFANIILGNDNDLIARILFIILSFVLAILTFLFIEKPLRFGKRKLIEAKLVLALVFTTVIGTVIFVGDGLPDRQAVADCSQFNNEIQWVNKTYIRDPKINGSYAPVDALSIPWGNHGRSGWYQYMYNDSGGDETYAIWGNSYGRHAFYGFANIFGKDNINVLYIGGWTPKNRLVLPDLDIGGVSSKYARHVVDFLSANSSIRKIFIIHSLIDTETVEKPEMYAKKMQDVIDLFISCGKQVYLVQQNPTLPSNIRYHIKRPLKDYTKLVVNKELYDMECEKLHKFYSRLNNIDIIDTAPLWCPGTQCRVYDDNDAPLYTDKVHLNRTGSMMQAEYVKQYMQKNYHGK